MKVFYKTLELKPNYIRAWVNLGLIYNKIKNYEDGARMFLNALSLN